MAASTGPGGHPPRLPARADALVIGAGAAGLIGALALVERGLEVVLLEGDGRVGGTAGSFVRNGFRFPTGPLGFTVPDEVARILRAVGGPPLAERVRERFRLRIDDRELELSRPFDLLSADLGHLFPDDRRGIREFFALIDELVPRVRRIGREAPEAVESVLGAAGGVSSSSVLEGLVRSPLVRSILGTQGSGPPVMPMGLLAAMWDFLAETGIWYPAGGIASLMDRLAARFVENGGTLCLGTSVSSIETTGSKPKTPRVVGVMTNEAGMIRTPRVIAAIDAGTVVEHLLAPDLLPADYREELLGRGLSGSLLSVSLGVESRRVDFSRIPAPHLLWTPKVGHPVSWPDRRGEAKDFDHDEIWITRLGLLDPGLAPAGHEVVIIRADAPYEFYLPVRHPERPHDQTYYDLKHRTGQALVGAVEPMLPGIADAVTTMDVATPLTYEFWGHRRSGAVAGWSWAAGGRGPESLIDTPISGLAFAGILAYRRLWLGGMGSAMRSGLEAAEVLSAQ